jgi:hypothetical protein
LLDQPDPENPIIADDQSRRYPRLSKEERDQMLGAVRGLMQEGLCPPNLDDSLLCLDWSLFHPRTIPEHEHNPNYKTPPEFRVYALSALDAYVTALLNTRSHARAREIFHYTCSLKQDAAAQLQMELKTSPEQPWTGSRRVMMELLNTFPRLLKARGIEAEEVAYMLGEGHRMQFAYPGKMVASVSPYLHDRPVELWPSVTLSLAASDELVTRARRVTAFLLDPEAGDRIAN